MKLTTFSAVLVMGAMFIASCEQAPPAAATEETAAPVPAKPDLAQIRTEIQTIENAWAAAQNAKDLNALMAMYTDDAVSMPDGQPANSGKAAIQKYLEKEFAKNAAGNAYAFETLDVYAGENTVTEVGKTTIKDASGKVVSTGKYVAVFEKRDGKYLCIREIFNDDSK